MARTDAQPRRPRRAVSGVLVLDKPQGMTSNAALQRVKWLFRAEKAGHTGSLDPLATGVLPLCFGEATKFSQYLLDADKTYRAEARLGVVTDSGDADGKIVSEQPVPTIARDDFELLLKSFTGEIAQVPSMFSALKQNGRPLYELARQGVTVERAARQVRVTRLVLEELGATTFAIEAYVSKGTYIRSLVEDIGQALGCGAHVTALRRLAAGPFVLRQAVTLAQIEQIATDEGEAGLDRLLLPVDVALEGWPVVTLTPENAYHTRRGQSAWPEVQGTLNPAGTKVAMYEVNEDAGESRRIFIGIGEIGDDGRVAPRRLVNTSDSSDN